MSTIYRAIVFTILEIEGLHKEKLVYKESERLTEYILYIPLRKGIVRWYLYIKSSKRYIDNIILERGAPLLTHVHVAYKMALIANSLYKKQNIPYIVTEHFTAFTADSELKLRRWIRWFSKRYSMNAYGYVGVSGSLCKAINMAGIHHTTTIYNPIDTTIFKYKDAHRNKGSFIHVSNLREKQKNVAGILQAFASLLHNGHTNLHLTIVSSNIDRIPEINTLIAKSNIEKNTTILGPQYPHQIAHLLNIHEALVMFSNFETFSLVVAESLCCGTPVIATKCGGPEELIKEGQDGCLIEPNDVAALIQSFNRIIGGDFDHDKISNIAVSKFSDKLFKQAYQTKYAEILKSKDEIK